MGLCGSDTGCMSVHSVTRPKAKKAYCCKECGDKIEIGDRYRRDFMVWEGEPNTHITCQSCDNLIEAFFKAIPERHKFDLSFEIGDLQSAVVQLRAEFGVVVEGFSYPEEPAP